MRKLKIIAVTRNKKGRRSISIPTIYEDLLKTDYVEMSEKDGIIMLRSCARG